VQDLVYNRVHVFLGERRFETWRAALRAHRALPYDIVLPGHGLPGGKALYDDMLTDLDAAEVVLASSVRAAEFGQRMQQRFPHYGGHSVLQHQIRFLFPEKSHA
jgi:hypothetical protein